jgi:hypothetical protein
VLLRNRCRGRGMRRGYEGRIPSNMHESKIGHSSGFSS